MIIADSKEFYKAITLAAKITTQKSAIPLSEYLEVISENGTMTITAFNGGDGLIQKIPCNGDNLKMYLIPNDFKAMTDWSGDFTMEFVDDNIEVKNELPKEKISVLLEEMDWYKIPAIGPSLGCIDTSSVHAFMKAHKSFLGKDDLRLDMTGYEFKRDGKDVIITATDGHTLATTKIQNNGPDFKYILKPLLSVLDTVKISDMYLSECKKYMFFKSETGNTFITRILDENYPNWKGVVPENKNSVLVNTKDFLSTIKKGLGYANEHTKQTRINIDKDMITATFEDLDSKRKFEKTIPCSSTGNIVIGFNGVFLEKVLSLQDDKVVIKYSDPNRAISIYKGNTTYILMPVMLSNV